MKREFLPPQSPVLLHLLSLVHDNHPTVSAVGQHQRNTGFSGASASQQRRAPAGHTRGAALWEDRGTHTGDHLQSTPHGGKGTEEPVLKILISGVRLGCRRSPARPAMRIKGDDECKHKMFSRNLWQVPVNALRHHRRRRYQGPSSGTGITHTAYSTWGCVCREPGGGILFSEAPGSPDSLDRP